jgi:Domain of unknown function (DUF4270)
LKRNLVRLCYAISAVMLLCFLNSCKDPVVTDKGNTLNFQSFDLFHVDTCRVMINTVPDRPLLASGPSTGVLGSVSDLFFGNTFASIYSQCLLVRGIPNSFSGCVLDSAVLVMPYVSATSKYGKCNAPIDINVYEVSQDMIPGNTYYSYDAFSVYPLPIGQRLNFVPDLVDSVHFIDPFAAQGSNGTEVPYVAQGPQLRVRLSNSFASKLLAAPDSIFQASSTFIGFFKGLYITTNPNKVGNGYMYLALNSSGINLYYHHTNGSSSAPIDTLAYQFSLSTYGVTANHFDHYYNGSVVQTALSHPNAGGDKAGYVQAGGGTKIKLTMPTLKNVDSAVLNGKKVPVGVTKAELILPILDTLLADPSYPPPSALSMYIIDDHDSLETFNANNYSGVGYLTTRQDEMGRNYLCYVFTITEYVQRVFNGYYSNNKGYYIGYSYTVHGDRVVILNDPARLSTQCKLKITYTKLN